MMTGMRVTPTDAGDGDHLLPPVPDVEVAPEPWCPAPVDAPVAVHRWDDLTFLHWSYEPGAVQALLPEGFAVETFGGRAWVSLVAFRMVVTRPGAPVPPWAGRFLETNVRTYVRGPDGGAGVWFLSLDAARLGVVVTARQWFGMPYHWSRMRVSMSVARSGRAVLAYRCRRRWPGPPAASRLRVEVGERLDAARLGPLDHWLTARWTSYAAPSSGLRRVTVDHDPWTLHEARVLELDDGLVAATGLDRPTDEPIIQWSPGIAVRIGRQQRAGVPSP
jgi:uncharacterized protein YqjF (DUF2071 family)